MYTFLNTETPQLAHDHGDPKTGHILPPNLDMYCTATKLHLPALYS